MIDFSDDIFVDLEDGKTYTEEEKEEIILKGILKSNDKIAKRAMNIGTLYRLIIKELYDIDPVSSVQFMKTFDNIPDLKSISFLNSVKNFQKKAEEVSFLTAIVFSLNTMPKDETDVLWKSFFYNCKKKENKTFYSKSTFYRLRHKGCIYLVTMTNSNYLKVVKKRELKK